MSELIAFPSIETSLLLPGPAGVLETIVTPAAVRSNKIAIVCHPHPLHGGTMNNKVVTMAAKAMQQLGYSTIRFNYRGVGASTGHYGEFIGETADLFAIMDWVQSTVVHPQFCLIGFSFGSYIAAQGALQRPQVVEQLISIAPAVTHADFNEFIELKCPWLVIMGTDDEVVPLEAVRAWLKQLPLSVHIQLAEIPGATHFFHGKLLELRDIIVNNNIFRSP